MSERRRIGGFTADVFRSATNGRYVSIPRGDLAKIIYQKIEGSCETIFGDSVMNIEQSTDRVHVSFRRAAPRDFDIVIGADGLHSVVRKLIFGQDEQFEKFLGYGVAAFAVNGYRPRDEDVKSRWRNGHKGESDSSATPLFAPRFLLAGRHTGDDCGLRPDG